jgi:uncharacterized membrane protein YfcA
MADAASLSPAVFAALVCAAFVAGFVDAIAGGGGLITVPCMTLAGLDPVTAIATNKLQSSFGSGSATLSFARAGHLRWNDAKWIVLLAAAGAIVGASLLASVPTAAVITALPVLLVAVALYFALSPRIGDKGTCERMSAALFATTIVPLIGCYDGLFGPGTGSFFMLAFVGLRGLGLIAATARTKAANFASNVAGLATLAFSGHVIWTLGFAMGLAQFAGANLGARAAMLAGARLAWERWPGAHLI